MAVFLILFPAGLTSQDARRRRVIPTGRSRIVVPFAPGGVTDVMARLLAQKLSENLGKEFFVDNRAGAGGNIGTGVAASAPADGYTLVLTSSSYVINPAIHAKIPYDPEKDLVPVTISAVSPNIVTVNPSLPVRTIAELIAHVRQSGKASFASAASPRRRISPASCFACRSISTWCMSRSTAPGLRCNRRSPATRRLRSRAFRRRCRWSRPAACARLRSPAHERLAALPDLPTMAEAGVPDQEAETMLIILVPCGDAQGRSSRCFIARSPGSSRCPKRKQRLDTLGFEPLASTPADSATRIRQELSRWAKVVRDAKIAVQNP